MTTAKQKRLSEVTKLKLGVKVNFTKVLVKSHEHMPDNPELMTPEQKQKWEDGDPVLVQKRVIKELDKPKDGIIVGKRRISVANLLDWVEGDYYFGDYVPDGRYHSIETTFETVYLVASNMKGFYHVRPEDLQEVPNV